MLRNHLEIENKNNLFENNSKNGFLIRKDKKQCLNMANSSNAHKINNLHNYFFC